MGRKCGLSLEGRACPADNGVACLSGPLSESFSRVTRALKNGTMLTFDLHPLYASILQDGAVVRRGEVLGLDGDLRRVLVAPVTGTIRLLVTGTGPERRVKVFLTEQRETVHASVRR